eukprot:TRINITY_DN4448_c0_g2_i1.p1 TRINITY_DN4448_c0_g2~~TRINITY_DN4448_c0_g2_i1.p1  ORF type:complete len:389 (-),score=99.17 TRINITY_DN4448_c0_g2_i1:55-1221(-)
MDCNTLQEILLDNHEAYDILLTGGVLPLNHLSQDAIIMAQAGATTQQIQYWYNQYKIHGSGYAPPQPLTGQPGAITTENWREWLGKHNWAGWVHFFKEEAKVLGLEGLVGKYLEKDYLGEGSSCNGLHGMISIGYGMIVQSPEVVAEGLALIAWRFVQLEPLGEVAEERKGRVSTLEELEKALLDLAAHPSAVSARSILKYQPPELLTLSPSPFLLEFESRLCIGDGSEGALKELLEVLGYFAVWAVYRTGCKDFLVLHLLTAIPALKKICLAFPSLAVLVIRRWWIFALTAYLFKGAPQWGGPLEESQVGDWEEMVQKAFVHLDEHTVKGVLVCKEIDGGAPERVRKMIGVLVKEFLAIPSPPTKKWGPDDWVYPNMPSPHATLNRQ